MAKSTYIDENDYSDGVLDVDAQLVDDIEALLDSDQQAMVLNLVADLHPADMAILISHLPAEHAGKLFKWLSVEQGGEVLPELDSSIRASLLEEAENSRVTALIDELETDDAAERSC